MAMRYSNDFLSRLFSDSELNELLDMVKLPEEKKSAVAFDSAIAREKELNDWIEKNGRLPSEKSDDVVEKSLFWRLTSIGEKEKKYGNTESDKETVDEELLAQMLEQIDDGPDLTDFSNLPFEAKTEKVKPDYISRRRLCHNFAEYEPLFKSVQDSIENKKGKIIPFSASQMKEGRFFIVGGLLCLVVEIYEKEKNSFGRQDNRLHLVFANGTESNMLFSTFQKIMSDEFGRYVEEIEEINPNKFQLESDKENNLKKFEAPDMSSGYIYILKSLSDDDALKKFNGEFYKIGVTKGTVQRRIRNAKNETTYLCAPVRVVEQWKCFDINTTALEHLLQNFLKPGQVKIRVKGKDGLYYIAEEWFNVPLKVIEDTVRLFLSGQLQNYRYDVKTKKIIER